MCQRYAKKHTHTHTHKKEITHTNETKHKKYIDLTGSSVSSVPELPMEMAYIKGMIDPNNDKNHYIFGSLENNLCWKYDFKRKKYIELNDEMHTHANQLKVRGHECALFEIPNDESYNDSDDKYALIYGGNSQSACYLIYEFKNETWNENAIELNDLWFDNTDIMRNGKSKYGFGQDLSMITDLFEKNKIHFVGGELSETKYGVFEFNREILLNRHLRKKTKQNKTVFWVGFGGCV